VGTGGATGLGGGTLASGGAGGAPPSPAAWDWNGVVGTGQSLAVGDHGNPIKARTQPYHNLKLSTGTAPWPFDATNPMFAMVPLIEPIGRMAPTYPSSYPTNISGETAHSAMGNQITALVMAASGTDYVNVQGEFGENGQCMTFLRKGAMQVGVNGRAYAGTLVETQAITRLAKAANKTYGVGAIIVTHGECDAGNTGYEAALFQLWSDYNTDLSAITGQTQRIQMIVSQQHSTSDRAASTLAQWKIGVDHPADIVCSGPKYQYPYDPTDHTHMPTDGYEQLGEKYAQVYFERVVLGHPWQPLQPLAATRAGRVITVQFHVPVPPLVWDTLLPAPNQAVPAKLNGKGFEVRGPAGNITISSVAIGGDTVSITCATDLPATGLIVGYAVTAGDAIPAMVRDSSGTLLWTGPLRWGQLRDSDPFVGTTTKRAQPNYSVAFEMPVP
jgi:hypothetical protein